MRRVTIFYLSMLLPKAVVCIFAFLVFCHFRMAVAQDPADALRNMFEKFGKQSEQFMPGMFSELSPAEMAELEKVPISKREEADFGDQVLKNYETIMAKPLLAPTQTPVAARRSCSTKSIWLPSKPRN